MTGVHFKGHELIPGIPDLSLAEFQKNHLLNTNEWLEDEEAEKSRVAIERWEGLSLKRSGFLDI